MDGSHGGSSLEKAHTHPPTSGSSLAPTGTGTSPTVRTSSEKSLWGTSLVCLFCFSAAAVSPQDSIHECRQPRPTPHPSKRFTVDIISASHNTRLSASDRQNADSSPWQNVGSCSTGWWWSDCRRRTGIGYCQLLNRRLAVRP